ncbi:hypothetical protein CEXT_733551 [Caerostris extrusa]|uniref:Uncharacterized protein n=1 Tax=Caerostris extrusa TaxID=172846 RepID=A0AAV4U1L5_CAEEX|nr:hypothetical protein CEXT_733551 [Caerostris extrusa]
MEQQCVNSIALRFTTNLIPRNIKKRKLGLSRNSKLLENNKDLRHFRTFSPRSSKSRTPARAVHFSKTLFVKHGVGILISAASKQEELQNVLRMKSEFLMRLAGFSRAIKEIRMLIASLHGEIRSKQGETHPHPSPKKKKRQKELK